MNTDYILSMIYLGDRACKAIHIDCWNNLVKIQIDCISKCESPGNWNYNNKDTIDDGYLVFKDTGELSFSLNGIVPNDAINGYTYKRNPSGTIVFHMYIDRIIQNAPREEIAFEIHAQSVHLEDAAGNIVVWSE